MAYPNGQTTVENTSKKMSKNINNMKNDSADAVEGVVQDVTSYVREEGAAIYSQIEDRLSTISADLKNFTQRAEKTMTKHPYYTVAGAAAVGILAGLILRGRSRR